MRILIYGINFSPELTGIGKYSGEMAEWLTSFGHEIRVVTAPPYYPQWRIADGFANWWGKEQVQDARDKGQVNTDSLEPYNLGSVVVYRCPFWVPAKPSGLKRLIHLASFALSSFPIMLRQIFWRPDVVWAVEPALFCAPAAWFTARLCGAKAWLHVQDFEVDAAFDLRVVKAVWLRHWVLAAERWLMRRFDYISTISARMQQRLLDKGVSAARVQLFQNWVDIEAISYLPKSAFRSELNIPDDSVVALYSGNMGEKQGLEIVIEAARVLEREKSKIRFVLCGEGAAKVRMQALAGDLSNVLWLPLQPLARLNELLNLADIHLLPQRADAADLVMPSKLTGMLASGRPVLATAHVGTELAEVVTGCGLVVTPGNVQAFVDALQELAADGVLRDRLGKAARKFAEDNLSKESILLRFEKKLKQLIEK